MTNISMKTSWDHIRRSPFQALAAAFVLTITFFVITIISVLAYSSEQTLKYFETRPQVIAFLKDDVGDEQVTELQNKLRQDVRLEDVSYITKEEALEIYKMATADNPLLTELVSPSIFPASLEFSFIDLSYAEEVINELKEEEIVEQVGFTATLGGEDTLTDVVSRLRTITYYMRVGGGIFAGLLVGTSFFVLLIIISMRMTTKKKEIEILDLIGATPAFVRNPIILEALIYTFVGVFMGWLIAFILVLYATPTLLSYFGDIPVVPRDSLQLLRLFGILFFIELLVGIFIALIGSMLAVSRAKRRR